MDTRPTNTAFPAESESTRGLSKREYFAAQIITSLNPDQYNDYKKLAIGAVTIADCLIEALNEIPISAPAK
jgi:hypothetical protein